MGRTRTMGLLLAGALLAGCQSRPAVEPLSVHQVFPVTYSGSVGPQAGERFGASHDEYPGAMAPGRSESQPPSEGPYVMAQAVLVRMRADEAAEYFGMPRFSTRAVTANSEGIMRRLEQVCERADADVLQSPSLTLAVGQTADLQMVDQVSYLKSFQLESAGDAMLADPEVSVAQDGTRFQIKAHPLQADQPLSVDLTFTMVELVDPLPLLDISLPLAQTKAQIQVPLYVRQEVETTVSVQPDESVIVAGLHGDSASEVILVVLRVEPVSAAASVR